MPALVNNKDGSLYGTRALPATRVCPFFSKNCKNADLEIGDSDNQKKRHGQCHSASHSPHRHSIAAQRQQHHRTTTTAKRTSARVKQGGNRTHRMLSDEAQAREAVVCNARRPGSPTPACSIVSCRGSATTQGAKGASTQLPTAHPLLRSRACFRVFLQQGRRQAAAPRTWTCSSMQESQRDSRNAEHQQQTFGSF